MHYYLSEFETVLGSPLLHNLEEVLDLGVVGALQHLHDLNQSFLLLHSGDHHLEHSDRGSTLTFPEFWVRVKSLQNVESFGREVELAHFVGVIGNEVEQGEGLVAGLHVNVDLPGQVGLLVHDVALA